MDLLFLQCGFIFVFVVFLQMEGRMVRHLAIDRPSHKFVSFLKKYYGLKNAIPQVGRILLKVVVVIVVAVAVVAAVAVAVAVAVAGLGGY